MKRAHIVAPVVVLLLAVAAFNLPGPAVTRAKLALSSLFVPFFGLNNAAQRALPRGVDALTTRAELIRQNARLREENDRLRVTAWEGEEARNENARLRTQLGWQQRTAWKVKPARVISRDPANWWRTVQIDLGSRDGVPTNAPVLTPEGLVGRITTVGLTRSQVVLLGDPNCRVAAVVENDRRDTGILMNASPLDPDLVELNYLPRNADVKPGQAVSTSGLGGIFPRGIPIGTVVDSRAVEFGLHTQARVKLAANVGGLEEVWVVFP